MKAPACSFTIAENAVVCRYELQLHSQDPRRVLDILHNARHRVFAIRMGMPEGSHASESRHDVFEQLQAPIIAAYELALTRLEERS
jgi:hypothetical protein